MNLDGTTDPGITYASEVEFKPKIKNQNEAYFAQKFTCSAKHSNWLYYIFEIEVKYFANGKMHAMLVGSKLLFTNNFKFNVSYKERPLIKRVAYDKAMIAGI